MKFFKNSSTIFNHINSNTKQKYEYYKMTLINLDNNNNRLKFPNVYHRRPIKDYSSLFYTNKIERENTIIYKRLIQIYTRKPQLAIIDKQLDKLRYQFELRRRDNKNRTVLSKSFHSRFIIKQPIPTKYLSKRECLRDWNKMLKFKKQRQLAKKAKFANIFI